MAKEKVKKVSINALEKALKNNVVEMPMEGNEEASIVVTKTLSLVDMLVFVREVVESVIEEDTGIYRPEMQEYMMRYCVMTMYANLTMPKDPEKTYMLMYNTDVYDQIYREINKDQYYEIENIIQDKIEHSLAMIRNSATKQAQEYVDMMQTFTKAVEPMFDGVSGEDVSAFFKRMSEEDRLSEDAIVQAVRKIEEDVTSKTEEVEDGVIEFKK